MAATAALVSAGRALMVAAETQATGGAGGEAHAEQLYCDAHHATYDVPVDDIS